MNLEWLQSFSDAVEQKSFSKASKLNNLSQPALSKHIKNLENDLNIKLFYRTPTGSNLTDGGEYFYKKIKPILSELKIIHQELQQFRENNPLVIGSLPSLGTYYIPAKIKDFEMLNRPLRLMIQNTSDELLQSLQEDRLDAILVDTDYNGRHLQKFELFSESYYAVVPLNHKFNSQKSVTLEELCKEPLIIHQSPCDTRNHIVKQMNSLGQKPNILNELDFSDFIFGSVSSGMGITIVPELIAKNIGHLNLSAIPITNFGRNRTISLLSKNEQLGLKLYTNLINN